MKFSSRQDTDLPADQLFDAVSDFPRIERMLADQDVTALCTDAGERLVVVAENHTVIGGLGEAVAALLMRAGVHPLFRHIGLPDEFLAAGALPTLHDRYGISTEAICAAVKGWR